MRRALLAASAAASAAAQSPDCVAALVKDCAGDQGKPGTCARCVTGHVAELRAAGCSVVLGTQDDTYKWCHAVAPAPPVPPGPPAPPRPPAPPSAAPRVVLPGLGTVTGTTDRNVRVFEGVPYAEPVSGEGRWRPPTAKRAWNDTLTAASFGATCHGSNCADQAEDCLFLNVYAPSAASPSAPLPVMVWIHGGGFAVGCSNQFDGTNLIDAAGGSVLVVTLNYRLNVFGFLASDALRNRSADGSVGNYGLQDQRLAVRWVKDHIAAFGGDPGNVMLFGESAGSASVGSHLVMPSSAGLFHKAGMESGSPGIANPLADAEPTFADVLSDAGCSSVSCLVATPAATLKAWFTMNHFGPTIDGVEHAASVADLMKAGKQHKVPVLLGTNRDEGALFPPFSTEPCGWSEAQFDSYVTDTQGAELVPAVKALYSEANYTYPDLSGCSLWWWAAMRVYTDTFMTCSTRQTARWLAPVNPSVHRYLFAHPPAKTVFGHAGTVAHATEIGFVWHEAQRLSSPAEDALSRAMNGYWVRFAQTGDPNGAGAPSWPADTATADVVLRFDVGDGGIAPQTGLREAQCDFWDVHDPPKMTRAYA